jgi:hypothetical protein
MTDTPETPGFTVKRRVVIALLMLGLGACDTNTNKSTKLENSLRQDLFDARAESGNYREAYGRESFALWDTRRRLAYVCPEAFPMPLVGSQSATNTAATPLKDASDLRRYNRCAEAAAMRTPQ